jgi:hypothetical protein
VIDELGSGSGEVIYLRDAVVSREFPFASGAEPPTTFPFLYSGRRLLNSIIMPIIGEFPRIGCAVNEEDTQERHFKMNPHPDA